jgi:hypothetical protein
MVHLDRGLIRSARTFINGANVNRGRELIFVYQQAVLLHNARSPGHVVYQDQHERALREFTQPKTYKRTSRLNSR